MTEDKILQELIDQDPEFETLIMEVEAALDWGWATNALGLTNIRMAFKRFRDLPIKEFFIIYKVIISWATLIGKIIEKNATSNLSDRSKAIAIPATANEIVLYVDPTNPPFMSIQLKDTKCSIGCKLNLLGKALDKMAKITFTLTTPKTKDVNGNMVPDLLNSLMDILVVDDKDPFYVESITDLAIKDFTPDKLIDLVRHAYGV